MYSRETKKQLSQNFKASQALDKLNFELSNNPTKSNPVTE